MVRSMTGFASLDASIGEGQLRVEIRSLNHRYREISIRLPEELRRCESMIRDALGASIGRGKVECNVRYRADAGGGERSLVFNRSAASQLAEVGASARQIFTDAGEPTLIDWISWPGVVEEREGDLSRVSETLASLVDDAVDQLMRMREREGEQLAAIIVARVESATAVVELLRDNLPSMRIAMAERLNERIEGFMSKPLDPGRLEAEVAIVLQRLDVDEELERLDVHLAEVLRLLEGDKPVGRRLDFLMQELTREANTLGSKSADVEQTASSVDLKVLIEQMREQVQNIE